MCEPFILNIFDFEALKYWYYSFKSYGHVNYESPYFRVGRGCGSQTKL